MEVAFWIIASVSILSALGVVMLNDIFRAALFLIACFVSVAGIFVLLSADFLAAIQILIYVGAISVLIILAIMLTREVKRGNLFNKLRLPSFFAAGSLLVAILLALANTEWNISSAEPLEPTTSALAINLLGEGGFILPVEISAVLLLAAILGAVVLVRDK
jgi:NADH-quinone oxidoreductase subunit J